MKNRGVTGPKVSHVLSSSAFCEKEQSGRERERERERASERGGGRAWGHETEGKKKKGTERNKGARGEPAV